MTRTLSDRDDFLHLNFPTDGQAPWKENYYFSYVDKVADAMGMLHLSIHRHKGIAAIQSHSLLGGEYFCYRNSIPFPAEARTTDRDQTIVDDGVFKIEVLAPMAKHEVTLCHEETRICLEFNGRMPPYLFEFDETHDRTFDVMHYEQSMEASGSIDHLGKRFDIACRGRRDHTWGFRNESALLGWKWAAFECEHSAWNLTKMLMGEDKSEENGFVMTPEGVATVQAVDVQIQERDSSGEPVKTRYEATLASGETRSVVATRFARMPILDPKNDVIVDENFALFLVEETGEQGIGIDEHARVGKKGS